MTKEWHDKDGFWWRTTRQETTKEKGSSEVDLGIFLSPREPSPNGGEGPKAYERLKVDHPLKKK